MIEGTIPMRTAVVLQDAALRVGASHGHIAGVSGVDKYSSGEEHLRVPIESAWRLWELIGSVGGPGAGLCVSATAERGALGVWDYLFTSRATLADSLRTVMEFRSAVTDPTVVWEVLEDDRLLTVRVGVAQESDPLFIPVEEFVLSLILQRVRAATKQHIVPVRVAFTHRVTHRFPHLIDEFGTGCIDFGAPFSEITFLDVGMLPTGDDPMLGDMLCHYAELQLEASRQVPDWRGKLHHAISDAMIRGDLALDTIACRLAISPRTLQRRLREVDSTWRAEVEHVRRDQVTNLLRDTGYSIQSVAARAGYTDARTLRRAFHRWTGQTPGEFRAELSAN
ncbi:helix-turn-helix domain-containing protein [Nocardia sp. NPDC059240]|uniref:AraC family transcriptional regulator n=1 Tax=Nocardia sp. NPDC059240 TaxID=3346786 RepID=UPI003698A4E0